MIRSKRPPDPHCVICHKQIPKDSDSYRLMDDYPPGTLGRCCQTCGQGTRGGLLQLIKEAT